MSFVITALSVSSKTNMPPKRANKDAESAVPAKKGKAKAASAAAAAPQVDIEDDGVASDWDGDTEVILLFSCLLRFSFTESNKFAADGSSCQWNLRLGSYFQEALHARFEWPLCGLTLQIFLAHIASADSAAIMLLMFPQV